MRSCMLYAVPTDLATLDMLKHKPACRWAKEMLRNVRMSCCVAGNCHLQASAQDVKETLELLAARLQLPTGAKHQPRAQARARRWSM